MRNSRLNPIPIVGVLLFLSILLPQPIIAFAGEGGGREAAPASAGSQFIIRLKLSRPEGGATEEEKAKIVQHFEYLQGLLSQGKLILAGMALDDYAGVVIIRAGDRLEAERIMASDPAVGANVFLAELHPFTVTLMSGGK
jgi:uncharacterized protein YciI